jgi:Uma2 family endonuclease
LAVTVQQFEQQYGGQKPYFEYWFGEPVQKAMPTWMHSLLQKIIIRLLDDAGYESGAEIKLKISPDFQPLPDVSAVRPGEVELPYPTHPVEIVVEILSADDQFSHVLRKCQFYSNLGIPHIYVVDGEARQVWCWRPNQAPVPVESLASIPVSSIWSELDRRLNH